MKKTFIFFAVMLLFTCSGCDKKQDTNSKEESTKNIKIINGAMETKKANGFTFDLNKEAEEAVITIKNVSAEKDQAYLVNFTINTKDGIPVNTVATIPPNLNTSYSVSTHLKSEDIISMDFDIEETTLKK